MSGRFGGIKLGTPVVIAGYGRALLDHLRARGLDPCGIYPADRVAEIESPDGPTQLALNEWLAMVDTAISVTADTALPLKVGIGVKTKHTGLLGYVVMSCATLGDAAMQLARYSRLVGDINNTRLIRRGRHVELTWQWAHGSTPPPAIAQVQLAIRISMSRWLTDRSFTASAHFQFKRPADPTPYDRFFGEKTRFGQRETKLVFLADVLELSVVTADPEMQRITTSQADAVLKRRVGEPEFLHELKTVLVKGLVVGRVSLAASARALNTSTRTLQRRLDEHRFSYRQVLAEVRQAQAERYLSDPRTSLAQVAFMLGYSEQSTFHNAFKKWSGMTPSDFRARPHLSAKGRRHSIA